MKINGNTDRDTDMKTKVNMNRNKKTKRGLRGKLRIILNLVLVFCVLLSSSTFSSSATEGTAQKSNQTQKYGTENSEPAQIKSKNEVVYARLEADGKLSSMQIVNNFEVIRAGLIADYGDYSIVKNLTDTADISLEVDLVNVYAQEGDFYYQGEMKSKDLPWNFEVSYLLDGKSFSVKELSGKSGKLEVKILSNKNPAASGSKIFDN